MEKYIYDESNGLWYERQGDYYIPCLSLPEDGQPIGLWGQRHLRYIKEHREGFYTGLLLSGKLNSYLADVDHQAQEQLDTIIRQMAQAQGVTEALKDADPMEWVGLMNNIRNQAMEIVTSELIYVDSEEVNKMVYNQPAIGDVPKIFWKYFDLYRRNKITLAQYSENTGLSVSSIVRFLRQTGWRV